MLHLMVAMEPLESPTLPDPTVVRIGFWTIYLLSTLYIFHSLLVAYINSTYMEQFLRPSVVSAFFTIGSAFSAVAFIFFTPLLRRYGNNRLTIYIALLDILSLIALGTSQNVYIAVSAFLLFLTVNPILFLNIDIYAESLIGNNEGDTGKKRGLTLTLMSAASLLSPLAMAAIVALTDDLMYVYLAAAGCFVIFVLFIQFYYKGFVDPHYKEIPYRATLLRAFQIRDVRNVCFAHFLLQMFFTWMIIYVPLYLVTELGYDWEAVGSILAVAMAAYVIFEYPVGLVADRYWGEQELMALGFLILAVSSSWIGFMTASATIVAWMIVMFISRVGAALVETTTESYFFKHTSGDDADLINVFRLLRPIASVFGALIGSICLTVFPFSFMFFILGFLMIPGLFFTMMLTDTR